MMRDRVVTNYIRKRLSIQNEKNRSQDRALGDPSSQKRRRGFYFIYSYCLCPTLQVRIKERQIKITDTESDIVSKAAFTSRRVRMEIEPESEAVMRSVSVLCFGR